MVTNQSLTTRRDMLKRLGAAVSEHRGTWPTAWKPVETQGGSTDTLAYCRTRGKAGADALFHLPAVGSLL
jgi:hypothetical protein